MNRMAHDLSPYRDAVEGALQRMLAEKEPLVAPMYRMMQYHMGWLDEAFHPADNARGKRLRPVFCLLVCEACGGDWRGAIPAACAIELVHNFSLLHDDIEDRSETRRHRPTAWCLWGVAQALNTGDAMWVLSRLATLELGEAGHDAGTVLRATGLLDRTCLELCTGQYLDIHFETLDAVEPADYMRMISGKTAALLSCATAMGAILAGADEATIVAYRNYGYELGITFQIVDDILGIWGDPAVTGKSAASDILEKKKTLPISHALEWEAENGCDDLARLYAREALTAEDVPAVLASLDRAGARAFCEAQAECHLRMTLEHLAASGIEHPIQETLADLARSLVGRSS